MSFFRRRKGIERDAVSIFQKYLSHDASNPVGISDQLRNECIRKICREDGEVDPNCFMECQTFILNKINLEYFSEFLSSAFHYRHQINVLTGSIVCLNDILYNEGSIFYFMEYMEQEGGSNLLQFLLAVDNFHKHLISLGEGYDGTEAQTDAMVIYDKYFSLQASHPLGFDDKIRFDVECNICREEGPLPDCFLKPRSIVLRTMEKMYFPGFLQSDIYYKYLSELVSTVQIASDLPQKPKHRRQDSDASSVHSSHSAGSESVSHKNTLLAMDTSHLRKGLQKLHVSDLNVDPALLNPENLWKRNDASMSLGMVDSYGRFVSEFKPHPDLEKSKGSLFFLSSLQEEEEMALKIAQMIISDVTSVTQAIGAIKNSEPETEGENAES
ncbi:hypothetical protein FSP39_002360 [Pinctada imbricata]|uniref:RGS domain-containing protein n=1 Tax=Pinctada imbricata TaxID=66713 RepID=A0AA89BQF7_PINIB|nr:hypothetical protein FSP39_002360 [Pinctada imbricata]